MAEDEHPQRIGPTVSASIPGWPDRPTPPAGAPNVVVMLVDDMGYSDIGPFGSEIPTPHLDAVAAEGVRLTDFHVTPTCSPTRAALLTGCNAHAVGMGAVANVDDGFPGYAAELAADAPTFAETLRDHGYATMAVGKWHLCREQDMHAAGDRHSWPLQRGFDQFYGFLEAQTSLFYPHQLYEGNSPVDVEEYPEGYYLTDDLTDRAVRMIAETRAAEPDKPLAMYFAHAAVHAPMHTKEADRARFRGRYDAGWDEIRAQRFARQQELGVVGPDVQAAPRDDDPSFGTEQTPDWSDLEPDARRLAARHMENYAAMITTIDDSVGRIREVLDRLGELENTIFLFFSDNGASGGGGHELGVFNHLENLDRSRTRTTALRLAEDLPRIDEIGGPTSWPQYATAWATVANTPFRRHKFSTYRGGHQVSCLMSWPAGLGAVGGGIRHQYGHVTDVAPTLYELIGVPAAAAREGVPARPLDGASMAAVLRDPEAPSLHGDQYYECLGERAYYAGDFEAVASRDPQTGPDGDRWELFAPEADPTQLTDLADREPAVLARLQQSWQEAAERDQVFPLADGTPLHWIQRDPAELRFARTVTILPEAGSLERFRASRLIDGRSFSFTAHLTGYHDGDAGVLVAHGGQESGYLLYIEDGAVRLGHNAWGRYTETDPVAVPVGAREITVDVHAPGGSRWICALAIDGTPVTEGFAVPELSWLVPFSGLHTGAQRRAPVSWDLSVRRGVFRYSGDLEKVVYRPGSYAPDAPAAMVDRFRTMGMATQ